MVSKYPPTVAGGLVNKESKICPLTFKVKLSEGISGSTKAISKHKFSPSSIKYSVESNPPCGLMFGVREGASLGGQAIMLS